MFKVPVTYYAQYNGITRDDNYKRIIHEFAANGAKHLVLTDLLEARFMAWPTLIREYMAVLQGAGMSFVDAHAPFGPFFDLNCPVEEMRPLMIDHAKLSMDIAKLAGVDTITIHVGNNHWCTDMHLPLQRFKDYMADALDRLLPYAENLGITICVENIWFPTNTPEVLLETKARFPTDALGFCYDSGHANLMDKGRLHEKSEAKRTWTTVGEKNVPWEAHCLEKLLPHVVTCHLHDNDGSDDAHANIGHGNIDWNHIIPLLNKAPRLKCVQSEVNEARSGGSIREVCEAFERLGKIE